MAQEVVTTLLCDRCLSKGERVNEGVATVGPIAIGKGVARLLDLCAECQSEVFAPLAELLDAEGRSAETGRRAPKRKATAEAVAAPEQPRVIELDSHICPTCSRTFNSDTGMRSHHTRAHGVKLEAGIAASEAIESIADYECPECGKRFERAQGLGAHRARSHGYRVADAEA